MEIAVTTDMENNSQRLTSYVEMIKMVRVHYATGLAEAKNMVDTLYPIYGHVKENEEDPFRRVVFTDEDKNNILRAVGYILGPKPQLVETLHGFVSELAMTVDLNDASDVRYRCEILYRQVEEELKFAASFR